MAEHPLMVQWVIGSIPLGETVDLFLIPASVPQLAMNDMCYPVCGMVHVKYHLLLMKLVAAGFLHYLNGPLPYFRHHITISENVLNKHFLPS